MLLDVDKLVTDLAQVKIIQNLKPGDYVLQNLKYSYPNNKTILLASQNIYLVTFVSKKSKKQTCRLLNLCNGGYRINVKFAERELLRYVPKKLVIHYFIWRKNYIMSQYSTIAFHNVVKAQISSIINCTSSQKRKDEKEFLLKEFSTLLATPIEKNKKTDWTFHAKNFYISPSTQRQWMPFDPTARRIIRHG